MLKEKVKEVKELLKQVADDPDNTVKVKTETRDGPYKVLTKSPFYEDPPSRDSVKETLRF